MNGRASPLTGVFRTSLRVQVTLEPATPALRQYLKPESVVTGLGGDFKQGWARTQAPIMCA